MKSKKRYVRKKKTRIMVSVFIALGVLGAAAAVIAMPRGVPMEDLTLSQTIPTTEATRPPETVATEPPTLPQEPQEADWRLTVVNPWNQLPEGYEPALAQLGDGQAVDERCYEDLQEMLADCRAAGLDPLVCSSYRTWKKQQSLYENKVERVMKEGYTRAQAMVEAAKVVAVPGTSEHQLGLAMDIVDGGHIVLDESQEDTATQQWLMANSWRYGFILRYPSDKSDITGIIYEPWHYRYVGRGAAAEIHELGLCLEEYVDQPTQAVG